MAKSVDEALGQVGQMWKGLTAQQKLLFGGGAALVALTLWAFVSLIDKPKYTSLYSGLKPQEAQALAGRLAAKNIAYQITPDGTGLQVPAEQLDQSRLETAAQGLPRNARLGFELFDTPNWAGSEFTEKVNYQRALEGELERTLQSLDEVEAVRVHLVMPHDSLFSEQQTEAKAAVILKTHGGRLSEEAQRAIPQLVASAVERLKPDNVTVVDADTNTPVLRPHGGAAIGGDEELVKTLVRTLEPVVGADHVRASVHVEYDLATSDNTEETYDPKSAAALSEQKSEESMGGGAQAGGVPGTSSNVPGGSAAAAASTSSSSDSQMSRSQSATYAVSRTVKHTSEPAGRIKRISAAVVVDDAVDRVTGSDGKTSEQRRKRTPEEMKQIEQLASAVIGVNSQRGDVLSIENLSFQQPPPAEAPAAPGKLDRVRQLLNQWAGVLRYAGLAALFAIVYLLVLRPVKQQLITAFRELPRQLAQPKLAAQAAGAVEIELPAGSEGARRASVLKQRLTEKVQREPASASHLVQGWMREDQKS